MDEIFGGSESKTVSTSTPKDLTPGAFKDLRGPFADVLRGVLGEVTPGTFTQGPTTTDVQRFQELFAAPETANEAALRGLLMQDAGGASGRQGLIRDTLAGRFLPGQQGSNPFLQAAIEAAQRPTLQGLEETLTRTLPGRFTQAGHFVQPQGSSAFDRAAAIATRGTADALADIATNLSFGVHEAERTRQQGAVGLSQAEVDTTIQNLQAQALPRLIQQFGIEKGLEEFTTRINAMLDILKTVTAVTSPTVAQQSESIGTSKTKPNIFSSLFPKGLGGGSLPIPGA